MLLLGSNVCFNAVVVVLAGDRFSTLRNSRCHTVTVFVWEHKNNET